MAGNYEKVLQGIHTAAEDATDIILNFIPESDIPKVTERLLAHLRSIDAAGASDVDRMVVIGALFACGYAYFAENQN